MSSDADEADAFEVTDMTDVVALKDDDGRFAVRLTINGTERVVRVRPAQTLLDAVRDELRLTGARNGCGVGMCGACTVLLDGTAVSGCLTLAGLCRDRDVRTVEGLAGADGSLDPVQDAFLRHRAFQCSYCTSGFILALKGLLTEDPAPDEAQIREAFSGHICRCGSYSRILAAARDAAGLQAPGTTEREEPA